MRIYDSLSGKKEELVAPKKGPLKLFVCGPTVYDLPHLGHARVYVFFDTFKKYLKSRGMKVEYLQNITDIDDKIIERAREEGRTAKEVARDNERVYMKTMKEIGVDGVDDYARASDHIKDIVKQIARLVEKGIAYKTPHGVYFEIKKFPGYGKLSKQNLDELRPGWRIEPDAEKKDPLDFALWKFHPHTITKAGVGTKWPSFGVGVKKDQTYINGEPAWWSPWGWGRPGWHIEDTAITEKYFGPQYDLHGGGMDLKFPHHESEIAQQEAASGLAPFVKIWMHVGFLMVNGEKMSKSLKNFTTVADFLKKWPAEVLRFMIFQHHYRSPLDYTDETARQAMAALDGIGQFHAKLAQTRERRIGPISPIGHIGLVISDAEQKFHAALGEDFNTPEAIAVTFSLVNEMNKKLWNLGAKDAKAVKQWLEKTLKTFGIRLEAPEISSQVKKLAKQREVFRASKQFTESDRLRSEVEALGYTVDDTPAGPFLWPKRV